MFITTQMWGCSQHPTVRDQGDSSPPTAHKSDLSPNVNSGKAEKCPEGDNNTHLMGWLWGSREEVHRNSWLTRSPLKVTLSAHKTRHTAEVEPEDSNHTKRKSVCCKVRAARGHQEPIAHAGSLEFTLPWGCTEFYYHSTLWM